MYSCAVIEDEIPLIYTIDKLLCILRNASSTIRFLD